MRGPAQIPLLLMLILLKSAEPASATTSLPFSEAQAIVQSAANTIASGEDAEFIEDCYRAEEWRKERLVRLAYVQAKLGDLSGLDQTITQAKQIGDRHLQPLQMASLGYSQAMAQDRKRAPRTLHEAIDIAHRPEYERVRDFALPTVVRAHAIIGDTEQAINTARLIRDPFFRVMALSHAAGEQASILDIGARSRLIDAALETISELKDPRDQANGLIAIGHAQVQYLDLAAGKDSLQKASSVALSINNAEYQADTVIQLAAAYSEANAMGEGQRIWNKALELTQQLQPNEQPYRLHYLASAPDKIRDWKRLSIALGRLHAKNSLIEDPYYRGHFIKDLADLHFQIGEPILAMERLAEARSLALAIPGKNLQQQLLMDVAKSYAAVGDSTSAITLVDAIGEGAIAYPYTYYYLARAQAEGGDIAGALVSFHAFPKDSCLKPEIAQAITVALGKAGDIESALAWANSLLSPYTRALALLGIVQAQFDN